MPKAGAQNQQQVVASVRALVFPALGVRPADIARAAGCSRQYVSKVLAGDKPPSARFLAACEALGLPIGDVPNRRKTLQKSERPPVAGILGAREISHDEPT